MTKHINYGRLPYHDIMIWGPWARAFKGPIRPLPTGPRALKGPKRPLPTGPMGQGPLKCQFVGSQGPQSIFFLGGMGQGPLKGPFLGSNNNSTLMLRQHVGGKEWTSGKLDPRK